MPLQLDELTQGQEPGGDHIGPGERLDHVRCERTRFVGLVDAGNRHAAGEVRIVLSLGDALERGVEVVAL